MVILTPYTYILIPQDFHANVKPFWNRQDKAIGTMQLTPLPHNIGLRNLFPKQILSFKCQR